LCAKWGKISKNCIGQIDAGMKKRRFAMAFTGIEQKWHFLNSTILLTSTKISKNGRIIYDHSSVSRWMDNDSPKHKPAIDVVFILMTVVPDRIVPVGHC